MTLHHSPAPSAPSYKSTPTSFLPETHPFTPTTSLHPIGTHLPPPLTKSRKREKSYHLTEEDIEMMRTLRFHPDPTQRKSRSELAKMFGCSQLFVGMAAPLPKAKVKEIFKEKEEQRTSWGARKRFFRDVRRRRKMEWIQGDE
jgi:Mitochondrial ribosomal protein subunit L20